MKKIILFILAIISFSPALAEEPSIRLADAALLAHVNKSQLKDDWHILAEQSFLVRFNKKDSQQKLFVPMASGASNDWKFSIYDAQGKTLLATLPKSESAIASIFAFTKIDALAFKDLNQDGNLDILAILDYFDSRPVQGEGIGGGSVKLSLAYISQGNEFTLNEDCEDKKNIKMLQACISKKLKH